MPKKKTKTLPDMVKEFISWKSLSSSDNTIRMYELYLDVYSTYCFNNKKPPLDRGTVHSFLFNRKASGCKGITLTLILSILKSFFKYFLDTGQIDENPTTLIPRFKEEAATVVGFTPDEAKILLEASYDSPFSHYWSPMILLGWHYGMRLGDCACFQRSFVDWEAERIKFIPMKRKRREIILPLVDDVRIALGKVPVDDYEYFFPLGKDRYYFRGSLSGEFKSIVKSADLKDHLTFHCLRHGAATRMLKAGVRTTTITEIIGWDSPAMLQRYIDRDEEDISKALEGSIAV